METAKKNYTIYWSAIGFKGGSYKSTSPTSAAKKAGNRLFKVANEDKNFDKFKNVKALKFVLRETTRGSKHNVFTYSASRKKLAKPVVVKIGNTEIVYKYTIDIAPGSLNKRELKMVGGADVLRALLGDGGDAEEADGEADGEAEDPRAGEGDAAPGAASDAATDAEEEEEVETDAEPAVYTQATEGGDGDAAEEIVGGGKKRLSNKKPMKPTKPTKKEVKKPVGKAKK